MSLFKKIFQGATKRLDPFGENIDLNKVYPRIKGLFDEKYTDPIITEKVIEIELSDDEPILTPYAESLGICYLLDKGTEFLVIQNRHLTNDLTIEKLHQAALKNLVSVTSGTTKINNIDDGVLMIVNGGNFEATMILADYLLDEVAAIIKDELCIAIPANDLLFIAGLNNSAGRERLRKLIKYYFDEIKTNGLVVRHIYKKTDSNWTLIETA